MKKKIIAFLCAALMALTVFAGYAPVVEAATPAPTATLTSAGSGQITVKWNAVSGASGYNIYRISGSDLYYDAKSDANGNYTYKKSHALVKIASVGNTTSYTDKTAVDGRQYEYVVKAVVGGKEASTSEPVYGHTAADVLTCWEIRVNNVTPNGFDATAKISSGFTGLKEVYFAVWTEANGQDDIKWYKVSPQNGVYKYHVNIANHGNQRGFYNLHVVARDKYDKQAESYGEASVNNVMVNIPDTSLKLTNPVINNVSASGYQVALTYSTPNGISKAVAKTWTTKNGVSKAKLTNCDLGAFNIIRANIKTSDHGNQTGEYNTEIYAYDKSGKVYKYAFKVYVSNAKSEMTVTHIDVGFGDSTLIESKGNYFLVDCAEPQGAENVAQILREKGSPKVTCYISHNHSDHAGGLGVLADAGVLKDVYIDTKFVSDVWLDGRIIEKQLEYIKAKGIPVYDIRTKKSFKVGDVTITCSGPMEFDFTKVGVANSRSSWMRLDGGGKSYLLSGDAELIAEGAAPGTGINLNVDFIKGSHHGTKTSSGKAYLSYTSPSAAFISDNVFWTKDSYAGIDRIKAAGIKTYRCSELGTIINRCVDGVSTVVGMKAVATSAPDGTTPGKYVYNGVDYSNEFDPVYYANSYADLKAAFGSNVQLLLQHWVQYGKREGRIGKASGVSIVSSSKYVFNGVDYTNEFDPTFYSNKYADLKRAFGTNAQALLQHYAIYGKREGRIAKASSSTARYVYNGVDYTNEFDPTFYSNKYADLKRAFGTNTQLLLQHWVQFGKREGRIAKAGTTASTGTRYVYNGVDYTNEFNPTTYANRYADLKRAFGTNTQLLLQHWVQYGKREGRKAI